MDHAGFAQYSIALSHVLVPIPDAVSFHDAAAVPCAGWTAYLALYHRLNIASGKNLVIAGASGGVGSFAVQLAKQKGVRIIATCSRKNFDFVKRLGADEVLDYNSENLVDRIKELCGPVGVHYWLDNVGSQSCDLALQVLAFGGHLGIVVAGPSNDVLSTNTTFYRCQSLHYVTLGGAYRSADPADAARFVQIGQDMLKMIEEGKLSTNISHLIGFDEIPKFLQLLKDGYAGNGKIVAKIVV
jgi:NADPH:quinone reductase